MSRSKLLSLLFFIFLIVLIITFLFYEEMMDITYKRELSISKFSSDSNITSKRIIYIGVISRYPPNIIYHGYLPLLEYLSVNTKYQFELKLSNDYNEAVNKLIKKEVLASFLGSFLYVKAHEQYGIIPILKPLNENYEPFSRSVLIVRADRNIYTIKDLIGKKLALPSKESFSGNWLTKIEFKKQGISESDLKDIQNFPHHQSVLTQVIKGSFDAGVVREYLLMDYPVGTIRIIAYSDKIPTSPLVVTKDYDIEVVHAIESSLLSLNNNRILLKDITKNWDREFIYGFTTASDSDYSFVKQINN